VRITRTSGLALCLALVAGCGTTVSGARTAAVGSEQTGGGLSAQGAVGSSGAATSTGGAAAGSLTGPGGVSGGEVNGNNTSGGGFGGPTGSNSGAAAPAGGVPIAGRGYDAKHFYLGFPTNNDVNSAAGTGLGPTNFGDQPGQIKAVIADINSHGGILGRTVIPVFHDIKTADLEADPQTQAEATCTALTQDTKVVAVVNIVAAIDLATFYACLAKADTPLISAGFVPADDKFFATYAPYLYKLTAASFTHLAPVWIDRLGAMGYFHGWDATNGAPASGQTKIGLLYPAVQPEQRDFADIKKRLIAKGYTVAAEAQYDSSSLNAESSGMSNAVLQFRNAGVTHVMSSESDVLLFMEAADGQHYRPRYAMTSYHAPAAEFEGTVPSSQLNGSMGVGWLPVSDVDAGHNPGPVSSGETSCRKIMKDAGQDISAATAAIVAFALCDGVRLIAGAVGQSKNPSSAGLHAGLAQIAAGFTSALTWRCGLSASRSDLPGAVREFAYNGSAYAYLSKTTYPV
jgi:hypothetical protein